MWEDFIIYVWIFLVFVALLLLAQLFEKTRHKKLSKKLEKIAHWIKDNIYL